ncbi:MAG: GMC family oxidoreductase [Phycisphaerales bacterium]|nr:GMC family oxidoreductase [Phycisphaerales bacterium]
MLVDARTLPDGAELRADVTIVGAGAAGIVLALELARAGKTVSLIESGAPGFNPRAQALADALMDPDVHPPMSECTRRQVGGTSVIWGGRVVPFDPADFDDRPYMPHSKWPFTYDHIRPYFAGVGRYLRSGDPIFDIRDVPGVAQHAIVPGLPDGDVQSSQLERWSVVSFGALYARELRQSRSITVYHGLTCTAVLAAAGARRTDGLTARTFSGARVTIRAGVTVLAAGGLNTTRLLLNSDQNHPGGIGNHSGMLGRFYTGHISGRIAEARFSTPPERTVFGFDRDPEGVYLRRRFTFTRQCLHKEHLSNTAVWLVNPDICDPAHGNGVLSFAYLALSSPLGRFLASEAIRKATIKGDVQGTPAQHIWNMLRDFPRTAAFIPTFGYKRYLASRKVPGFFQYSRSNTYPLHYFAEHAPNPDSRVTLTDDRDELGMRRIRIDMRYTQQDFDSVLRAHRIIDEHLRRHGKGELRYVVPDPAAYVASHLGDGYHQCGTTRMSERPEHGVTDPQGRVHGLDDLYILSSSTFVTSSQANSMFMILVLALRMAEHLTAARHA